MHRDVLWMKHVLLVALKRTAIRRNVRPDRSPYANVHCGIVVPAETGRLISDQMHLLAAACRCVGRIQLPGPGVSKRCSKPPQRNPEFVSVLMMAKEKNGECLYISSINVLGMQQSGDISLFIRVNGDLWVSPSRLLSCK